MSQLTRLQHETWLYLLHTHSTYSFHDAEQGNCGLWANDYQVGNLIYEIMTTLLFGREAGILIVVTSRRYYERI